MNGRKGGRRKNRICQGEEEREEEREEGREGGEQEVEARGIDEWEGSRQSV